MCDPFEFPHCNPRHSFACLVDYATVEGDRIIPEEPVKDQNGEYEKEKPPERVHDKTLHRQADSTARMRGRGDEPSPQVSSPRPRTPTLFFLPHSCPPLCNH